MIGHIVFSRVTIFHLYLPNPLYLAEKPRFLLERRTMPITVYRNELV